MGLTLTTGGVGTASDSRRKRVSTFGAAGGVGVALARHEALHVLQGVEPEAAVELVRVGGPEHPATQALELGVGEHGGHEPLAEAVAAVARLDVHVREPGE